MRAAEAARASAAFFTGISVQAQMPVSLASARILRSAVCAKQLYRTKKVPDRVSALSRTNSFNIDTIRGATLIHGLPRALGRIPSYPRQLTYACTSQNTRHCVPLTAPSAVHLTTCFPPGSQPSGLSVGASLPLSPLHRFRFMKFYSRISPGPHHVNRNYDIQHPDCSFCKHRAAWNSGGIILIWMLVQREYML